MLRTWKSDRHSLRKIVSLHFSPETPNIIESLYKSFRFYLQSPGILETWTCFMFFKGIALRGGFKLESQIVTVSISLSLGLWNNRLDIPTVCSVISKGVVASYLFAENIFSAFARSAIVSISCQGLLSKDTV